MIKRFFNRLKENEGFLHSKNYVLAEMFNKAIVFFTIPIFTYFLDPKEYGILAIAISVIGMFSIIMGLNINVAVSRRYYEIDNEYSSFMGTSIIFSVIVNSVIFFLCIYLKTYFSHILGITSKLFILCIGISAIQFFIQMTLTYLQASQKSGKYAMISIISNMTITIISIIFIINLKEDKYYGRIYSQLIVTILLMVAIGIFYKKKIEFKTKLEHLKYSLSYSLPLIPHELSGLILSQFDRIMINNMVGSAEAGLYSFAYNVGMIMNVFVISFNNAWIPKFYKHLANEEYNYIEMSLQKYFKVLATICFILILFSREIVYIMANEKYYNSIKIIPIIIFSYLLLYMYMIFANYAFYSKKTYLVSLFTVLAGVINVILNRIWIPTYGYLGASWATLLSYLALVLFHFFNSKFFLKLRVVSITKIMKDLFYLIIGILFYFVLRQDLVFFDVLLKIILILILSLIYYKNYKNYKNSIVRDQNTSF